MSGERAAWAAAFAKAQAEFPDIAKGRTAQIPTKSGGAYSYNYADLSDIRNAVVKVLTSNGLSFAQSVAGDGKTVAVTTRIYHAEGHVEEFGPTVLDAPGDARAVGSAITYARRYALAAALGIVPEEDDDGGMAAAAHARRREEREKPAEPEREKPAARLGRVLLELVGDLDESRKLAVQAKTDLEMGDGWADNDSNVDRVIERARQIVQNRRKGSGGTTTADPPSNDSEADSWSPDIEAWSKLYEIVEADPTQGNMTVVEQRVRDLYMQMRAVGLWPDAKDETGRPVDALHQQLAAMGLEHFGDLRVRASYDKFAQDSFERAKAALEEHAKKEAGVFPVQE